MFSRVAARLHDEKNLLYSVRDELLRRGHPVRDMVSGNVNELGIVYPQDLLRHALLQAASRAVVYRPDSLGQRIAREAISDYYGRQGIAVPADNVLLTPGTSISYLYAFKLLADEGEEILCPRPSYPLFDYIAALSGIRLIPYTLSEARGWEIEIDQLETTISTRTRAVALISPHNPTGHVSSSMELKALADIALRHDLAIISDEVFSEFLLDAGILRRPAASAAPLVLTLNGFSKMFALPGIKVGWMAVSGQETRVKQALRTLELISDTFLPVNEIAQAAVPEIFAQGQEFLSSYSGQIRQRWQCAQSILARSRHCSFIPPDGGFYVILKLEGLDEEKTAASILENCHLLVHPGYFYDLAPPHLVLSFVHPPEQLEWLLPSLLEGLEACALAG
jgi:alanine-synthesizing transaminase